VDRTVAVLVPSQETDGGQRGERVGAKKRLADAEARVRRVQDAIAAGIDPAAWSMRSMWHKPSGRGASRTGRSAGT
jgi:hypothetical protein